MGETDVGDGSAADAVMAAHDRLVAGDRVASEQLAELLLTPLVSRLRQRWPRWRHSDVLYDAAVDALLDHLAAPERFDPGRGSLLRWLEVIAHANLVNVYRSGRQRAVIETLPLSEVTDAHRNDIEMPLDATPIGLSRVAPDPGNAERLDQRDLWRRIREAFPDERERELIWACWVEGERSSARLARILGIEDLAPSERRRRVKDARDVARRKLLRMGLIDDEQR